MTSWSSLDPSEAGGGTSGSPGVGVCTTLAGPVLCLYLQSSVVSGTKAYLVFHRQPMERLWYIVTQWSTPCWVLRIALRVHSKWSIVIRQKLEWLRWQSLILSNWTREREEKGGGCEGKGEECGNSNGLLPVCHSSSPRLVTSGLHGSWGHCSEARERRSEGKWGCLESCWFPKDEKKDKVERQFPYVLLLQQYGTDPV